MRRKMSASAVVSARCSRAVAVLVGCGGGDRVHLRSLKFTYQPGSPSRSEKEEIIYLFSMTIVEFGPTPSGTGTSVPP